MAEAASMKREHRGSPMQPVCAARAWLLIAPLLLVPPARGWQQSADWLDLGPGECRPQPCQGCSHPWATRVRCMEPGTYLERCLDFAVFNATDPAIEGFQLRPGATLDYSYEDILYMEDPEVGSRGRRYPRWSFPFEEAASMCNASAECRGFECNAWSGQCSRFSAGEPRACGSEHCYGSTPRYCYSVICYDNTVYMKAAGSPGRDRPQQLAAVFFGESVDCPNQQLTCKAYDGADPALGVDTSTAPGSGRQAACYRPIAADGPRSVDTGVAISMEDADGQAITVLGVNTSVAMNGPFGFVSVHLEFQNPQDRTIEGRFRYMLPPGAAVQRLAMKIGGNWMEGEVVERARARRIWRSLLLQRRDPALLEQEQGNVFSAKVFPIFPRANVELILAYSTLTLMRSGVRRLTVPMAGLPPVTVLSTFVVLELGPQENVSKAMGPRGPLQGNASVDAGLTGFEQTASGVPTGDIVVEVSSGADGASPPTSLRAGDYVATWRTLGASETGPPAPRARGGKWRFYVDTSASTADTFVARVGMVDAFLSLAAEKAAPSSCAVFAFDMGDPVQLLAEAPPPADIGNLTAQALEARLPLGMTRLDHALQHVASSGADHVVLVTDAIATLGDRGARVPLALAGLPATTRVYILTIGSKVDLEVATQIAGVGGGRVVGAAATANATLAAARMARAWDELLAPIGATGTLVGDGATEAHPAQFFDLQPNSEVVYFTVGQGPGSAAALPDLQVNGSALAAPAALEAAASFRPLLEREGVRAQLVLLEHERTLSDNGTARAALAATMVDLSTRKRVLCPLTALLVLETEMDYDRFGVDRFARNDILVVTRSGVELLRPSSPTFLPEDTVNASDQEEETDEPDPDVTIPNGRLEDAGATSRTRGYGAELLAVLVLGLLPTVRALKRATLFEVAVATACIAALCTVTSSLQGCVGGDYIEDGCCWGPQWLDAEQWATDYMTGRAAPTERLRGEAQLWAEALAVLNRTQELLAFASAWLLWDPANPGVYEHLGSAALAAGDRVTALRAYASLAEVASSNAEMLLRAAWLCMKAEDHALAEVLAQRSIEQRDDNPNAYRALAISRYLRDDLQGAREAMSAARFPSPRRWTHERTPSILLRELQHMEDHAAGGRGALGAGNYSAVLLGPCADVDCTDLETLHLQGDHAEGQGRDPGDWRSRCEQAASGTGVPPNLFGRIRNSWGQVAEDRYDYRECPLCACGNDTRPLREPPRLFLVVSWLGDGNDVDLYDDVENESLLGPYGSSPGTSSYHLGEVSDGLGPEGLITSALGEHRVGTFYNWNAAMGSARGVLLVWVAGRRDPTILPFALPVSEGHIIEVARVHLNATVEPTVLWNPLMR